MIVIDLINLVMWIYLIAAGLVLLGLRHATRMDDKTRQLIERVADLIDGTTLTAQLCVAFLWPIGIREGIQEGLAEWRKIWRSKGEDDD